MSLLSLFVKLLTDMVRNVWGSINKPYATYRMLPTQDPYQLLILFSIIGAYFFFVSPVKLRTFHPFLLTVNATRLFTVTVATFILVCFFLLGAGKVLKREVNLRAVLLTWSYSLVPTLLWFLATSLFFVILPPPRQETLPGRVVSLLFISFSLSLFFWKGLLYYLTLRFALKLDLVRIVGVSLVFFPLLALYSLLMYHLGIFRVPFV